MTIFRHQTVLRIFQSMRVNIIKEDLPSCIKWEKKLLGGTELFEKTLGIIGSGRIGLDVAKKAGVEVIGVVTQPLEEEQRR